MERLSSLLVERMNRRPIYLQYFHIYALMAAWRWKLFLYYHIMVSYSRIHFLCHFVRVFFHHFDSLEIIFNANRYLQKDEIVISIIFSILSRVVASRNLYVLTFGIQTWLTCGNDSTKKKGGVSWSRTN